MKLDLGCGRYKTDDFVGMDIVQGKGVDIVHDIQDIPWPIEDNACSEIRMHNVWEHLEPKHRLRVMDEAWRVMKPGGLISIQSPHYGTDRAAQDPTHYTCPNLTTFKYFDPRNSYYYLVYSPKPWLLVKDIINEKGDVEVEMEAHK